MSEIFFWLAAVPVIAFPILYAAVARWWRTPVGRHEMALGVALLGLVTLGLLRRVIDNDYPGEDVVRLGVYLFTAAVLWWRVVLLIRVQIIARTRHKESREAPRGP